MLTLKGKHSTVYVENGRAIKVFKPQFKYNFWKEVRYLTVLQSQKFVPKLFSFNPSELSIEMEFIDGVFIRDFIRESDSEEIRTILDRCLDICYRLDRMRIQKEEMNHPGKHIIIRNGEVYFIDFERAYDTPNPSNVTQFVTFLRSIADLVKIKIPPVDLLKEYKKYYGFRSYESLKRAVFS